MLGKKTNNSQGIVWMPYIPVQTVQTISEKGFNKRLGIKSRYSTKIVNSGLYGTFGNGVFTFRNEIRKGKIENIFKIEKPTNQLV